MPGEREAYLAALPAEHEYVFSDVKLTSSSLESARGAEIISVFVGSMLTAQMIDTLPGLKLICTRSMGYDHIDVKHAKEKGIKVTNVTSYAAHPVAEFTFALLLAVTRKIYYAYNQLREGTDYDIRDLQGVSLNGRTFGVVGTGRIGKNVALLAKAFGMNVLINDAKPDETWSSQNGLSYIPLDDLLSQADIVSIHVPYMPETHHLMNAERFAKMKMGSILINTSRGEIVETHALLAALKEGRLWGAGLDVLEEERALKEEIDVIVGERPNIDYELLTANHVLIDHPRVIVTPHIAFSTDEAMREITRVTALAISDYLDGREIQSL